MHWLHIFQKTKNHLLGYIYEIDKISQQIKSDFVFQLVT